MFYRNAECVPIYKEPTNFSYILIIVFEKFFTTKQKILHNVPLDTYQKISTAEKSNDHRGQLNNSTLFSSKQWIVIFSLLRRIVWGFILQKFQMAPLLHNSYLLSA